jgi:alanyl-tRNA synthetase
MHKALREVLGSATWQQKGSLVDPDKTRFDFSHNAPVTAEQIAQVETIVNREILENHATRRSTCRFDDAVKHGAMALFGEKYGDEVRVLDIGSSKELCGGVHVTRTGDIGLFKIVSEGGVAAGIRRVEAVTGEGALAWCNRPTAAAEAAGALKTGAGRTAVAHRPGAGPGETLEKELAALKSKLASGPGRRAGHQAVDVNGIKVLAATMEGADVARLRETMDKLKDKLKTAAIVLASVADGKVSLIAGVTGCHRQGQGGRAGQLRRQAGGRQGRRTSGHGAGRRYRSGGLPAGAGRRGGWVGERV